MTGLLAALLLCTEAASSSVAPTAPVSSRASPSVRERFEKTRAFEAWLGKRVILDEYWVDVPDAGIAVGYFLAPLATPARENEAPIEDAFFVVDARSAELVADPLTRPASATDGCAAPGAVTFLAVASAKANAAVVEYAGGPQPCELRLRRGAHRRWIVTEFPDPSLTPDANFKKAARALLADPAFPKDEAATLNWSWLPGPNVLLAGSGRGCELWAVDIATSTVDWAASNAITEKICECATGVAGEIRDVDPGPVATTLDWAGPGTALPECECTFQPSTSGGADVECREFAGRPYSPAELAELQEEEPQRFQDEADAERLRPIEENAQAYRDLLSANRDALEAWRAGSQDDALDKWRTLYRSWVSAGRPAVEDAFGERAEEISALRGQPTDFKHATIDLEAEVLNNLGFALWSQKQFAQAEGAYDECAQLLERTGRERNVLHLNRGDLYRDEGDRARAATEYRTFLSGKVTAAQRKQAEAELRKLEGSR